MLKILCVLGTRPEAIKMAPVIKELRRHKSRIRCRVCVSAQHREMLDPFLKFFHLVPQYDLNIMRDKQSLEYITSTVLSQMGCVLEKEKPDYLLVQGDTTTAMAASLAAFYQKVKIGHIEAGLRTGDKNQPFPEEVNRRFIDDLSDLFFVPTPAAKNNLVREGKDKSRIVVTGNTVIDALLEVAHRSVNFKNPVLAGLPLNGRKILLVTAHRRENHGPGLTDICTALKELAVKYADEVAIVYPVHLNPLVQEAARGRLRNLNNVFLLPPLDYPDFVQLMKMAYLILSDSGGIQEEAPSFHKPVLVLRETTERTEALKAGATRLVGTQVRRIVRETSRLIEDRKAYQRMAAARNPYGDGRASERIVERLLKEGRLS